MTVATTSVDLDAMNLQLSKLTLYPVYGVFTTTGATVVVKIPSNCRRFRIAGYMWASAPATDEHLHLDGSVHTVDATTGVASATESSGTYTIQLGRVAASKTSGLGFFLFLIGMP